MKVEFRNLMEPKSDFQAKYLGILPYIIIVSQRSRKELSHWLYMGFLGWCIAIQLTRVNREEYNKFKEKYGRE